MNIKFFIFIGIFLIGCQKKVEQSYYSPIENNSSQTTNSFKPWQIEDSSKIITTPSGLKYYIIKEGTGNSPQPGQSVLVHYHGTLTDGTTFDSSFERGSPFETVIGKGQVIQGWDEGIPKMKVGGQAILIIPPHLGYGDKPMGDKIPANATLIFYVELLGIK
jgi:peptidylprolyl isomerase